MFGNNEGKRKLGMKAGGKERGQLGEKITSHVHRENQDQVLLLLETGEYRKRGSIAEHR